MLNIVRSQPPFFKLWLGPELVVVSSRPQDLEIILNKCFEKGKIIKFAKPILGDGLLIAHRKFLFFKFLIKKFFKLKNGTKIGKLLTRVLIH